MSVDPRVPTQDELERLEHEIRLDPASRHFVALGEAYIALGRPRDAVDVGARGLRADPANLAGRLMVGRALVALHQWKQAQAELLKVVKSDKQNREGFCLLGEVLMRRSDYERALPVLQHAQNLDPANPAVLALLKRARAGQALDPPAPIPSPRPPRGGAHKPRLPRPAAPSHRAAITDGLDDEPTRVADERGGASMLDDADTGIMEVNDDLRGDATQKEVPLGGYPEPEEIRDRLPLTSSATGPQPTTQPKPARSNRPSAAPPVRPRAPKVQPRINPAERRADAAREGLRQSAAMGEDYLNSLLKGGLLAVPNVDVPDEDLQFKIDRSVTPSAKRAFVFLFTLLFLATAGGVTWYVYSEKQKTADVDRRVDTALQLAQSGSYQDLDEALNEATAAMERDDKSEKATSTFAMVGALNSLLYKLDPTKAEFATTGARKYVESGEAGDRELLIAEAAIKLARLPEMERPRDELASLRKKLEAALAAGEDGWLRWLLGRGMLAAGDRDGAAKAFRQAEETPQAPLVATIDRANLLLDDGKFEEARKLYEDVLGKSENHPLAVIGLSLLRAETSKELAQAVDDLNVRLTRVESPRVDAYENLAFAYARYALQDYGDFRKHLDQAIGLSEPRFWARVGLLRLRAGLIKEAGAARQRMQWYGPENAVSDRDPLVEMLDAVRSLTLGRQKAALSKIGKVDGLRGLSLRARAHFDRGEYTEAVAELDKALAIAADDRELKAFREAARALSGSSKERREAMKELADIRLNSKSKVPSYLEGLAYLSRGKLDDARYALDKSVENISDEEPNRLAYRSHLALAEVYYRKGDIDKAVADINRALEINQVYLPTLVLLGKIELGREDWAAAADALGQVVAAAEENAADWKVELGYAEALIKRGGEKLSADDRKLAVASLEKAREKGADAEELGRVAALLGDEELMTKLGVEAPDDKKRR